MNGFPSFLSPKERRKSKLPAHGFANLFDKTGGYFVNFL
ncbi:hypothetical protein B4100_2268 [Heyndrickxia coagulans]|nr:hypothetical protein B4100_2268 [Heyndrickxia coagulans]